jgi:hypothetical protein
MQRDIVLSSANLGSAEGSADEMELAGIDDTLNDVSRGHKSRKLGSGEGRGMG